MLIGFHFGLCLIFNEEKLALKSPALKVIWWEQDIGDNVTYVVWFWVPIVTASLGRGRGETPDKCLVLAIVNSLYC